MTEECHRVKSDDVNHAITRKDSVRYTRHVVPVASFIIDFVVTVNLNKVQS